VRFQVLKVAGIKMLIMWAVEPCSLVEVEPLSDGGSRHLCDIGHFLRDCPAPVVFKELFDQLFM
jgi:hypothetical protein